MVVIERMDKNNVSDVAYLEKVNFSDGWSEKSLEEELDNENALYLLARDVYSKRAVGAAGLIQSFDEGEILNVSVLSEYRRQNIAQTLLTELVNKGKERGIESFTLEVRENNLAARSLYEKMGFVFEGLRPSFYQNPTEAAAIYWLR